MNTVEFVSPDIHCEKCAGRVREALSKQAGVGKVDVEPQKHLVRVEYDEGRIGAGQIGRALADAGYPPQMQ
jgi:copper chaperone CopZ